VSEAQGRFPEPPQVEASPTETASSGAALDAFHRRLLAVLVAHDLDAANQILGDVLALYSVDELLMGVLRPTLVDIGEEWAAGRISVATEHLASQFVRERLLMWMPTGPAAHRVRPTVLACAPDEWHDLSLLMLGVLLRRRRWPVAYLGQAVPLLDLAEFVEDVRPPAVVVVAMREASAEAMREWPRFMPDAAKSGRPVVCYAGRVFSADEAWRQRVPGIYLGASLVDGVARLESLLREATGAL